MFSGAVYLSVLQLASVSVLSKGVTTLEKTMKPAMLYSTFSGSIHNA